MRRYIAIRKYTEVNYGIEYYEFDAEDEDDVREQIERGMVNAYDSESTDWGDWEAGDVEDIEMVEDYDPIPTEECDDNPVVTRLLVFRDELDEGDEHIEKINDIIEKMRSC